MQTEMMRESDEHEVACRYDFAGFAAPFRHTFLLRATSWVPLIGLPLLLFALRSSFEPWAFMWLMLLAVVAGCKWLTWVGEIDRQADRAFGRSLGYLVAWPGMNARRFLAGSAGVSQPSRFEWAHAVGKLLVGIVVVWCVVRWVPQYWPIVVGWTGMIGLAFLLHFGLFHVLSLLWRRVGVDASHIFHSPALAHSVGDFWGGRWNLAFRDLVYARVFRPSIRRVGVVGASFLTFFVSGLIHELVISVPVSRGYGGPTAYFLLQWVGVLLERSRLGGRCGLRRGLTGWLFALVVVAGPVGLLFHSPFVADVVNPFLRVVGAF